MSILDIRSFARSEEKTEEWLKSVQQKNNLNSKEEAFVVLRSVLNVVRDRLAVNEAVDFGAQLPLLLVGVYYDGWTPNDKPVRIRSQEEFVNKVAENLPQGVTPAEATVATLNVIKEKITEGEVSDIRAEMPKEIDELWSGDVKI